MYELLKPDFTFEDSRGCLTQLTHTGYEQINVLETEAEVRRGNHYHKIAHEAFYVVSGSVEVTLGSNGAAEVKTFGKKEFFKIPPGVRHSMYFPQKCVLIAMYDKCVERDNGEKDIYSI